jgi:hypothetical protein
MMEFFIRQPWASHSRQRRLECYSDSGRNVRIVSGGTISVRAAGRPLGMLDANMIKQSYENVKQKIV